MRRSWLAVALAIGAWSPELSAQDVEMLGQRHGTRPPAAYYRELARDPEAYQFSRGRARRLREAAVQRREQALRPRGGAAGVGAPGSAASGIRPALSLGPREGPVAGDVLLPVVLGLFAESPAPVHDRATIEGAYFGTTPGTATVSTYYAEVSSDSIRLDGVVRDWVRSSRSEARTTQGESGLVCCGIGDFIKSLLALQTGVDWGDYDNDGPDGIPNSGDDDGFVDALAVMHPSRGAECDGSGDRIWSHKWSLSSASSDRSPYQTGTASANGGFIRVDDYFVQGVLDCFGTALNPIGVFVHETGHAFGLPDLYDTRQGGLGHAGAGLWDLMATGTWGCNGNDPSRPCHMGAWSKAMLGWVDVVALAPDADLGTLTLPPVETSGTVFRVDAGDGSTEYFLLENRRQMPSRTFDRSLPGQGGLLVWQIDADAVLSRWASNQVNASDHMGVWLRQADGRDDLGRVGRGRGDGGDPFPGTAANTRFHAATNPSARSFAGTATGLSMLDIQQSADDVVFDLATRFGSMPDQAVSLVATVPQTVQLASPQGPGPVLWTRVGGALPSGVTLGLDGVVSGTSVQLGAFPVTVDATDDDGLTSIATLTLDVGPPSIPIEQLASPFLLSGPALSGAQATFLDQHGNGDGAYDLGDFRAWVLADPSLPLSASLAVLAGVEESP